MLTHVLEHVETLVSLLKRVNEEWLAENGRFFLVCPNANAPSRQIAVKMGLISHNSAVTPASAERSHHRYSYTPGHFGGGAITAGLKVVHQSGIFFKSLPNFQWDRLLQTDIVSKEYSEGATNCGSSTPICVRVSSWCA